MCFSTLREGGSQLAQPAAGPLEARGACGPRAPAPVLGRTLPSCSCVHPVAAPSAAAAAAAAAARHRRGLLQKPAPAPALRPAERTGRKGRIPLLARAPRSAALPSCMQARPPCRPVNVRRPRPSALLPGTQCRPIHPCDHPPGLHSSSPAGSSTQQHHGPGPRL